MSIDCPDINIDCPDMNKDCPDMNIDCPDMSIDCPDMNIDCPDMNIDCPDMNIDCPDMNIECPLSLYDVTVTNMATLRNVQMATIEKVTLTESVLVLFGNINTITVVTIPLCLYDHKYMLQNNKACHFSSVYIRY
jgi:hypothetical protein